jgi:hypothetical protein
VSSNSWNQTLISAQVDGPTLSAAAAATMLPASARFTFPANLLKVGDVFRVTAAGRISNVVTTPGTARFDFRVGAAVVWDSQAMALNAVAKTNVAWWLDLMLTVRAVGSGTNATIIGVGSWTSESVVGSPLPSAGGAGTLITPAAPAVGTGFDSTVSNVFDMFFTQTVATGSLTLHEFKLTYET